MEICSLVRRKQVKLRQYVRQLPVKEFDLKFTGMTLKHEDGSIIVWGCFSWHRVYSIHRTKKLWTNTWTLIFWRLLCYVMQRRTLKLVGNFSMNNIKHATRTVKNWLHSSGLTFVQLRYNPCWTFVDWCKKAITNMVKVFEEVAFLKNTMQLFLNLWAEDVRHW